MHLHTAKSDSGGRHNKNEEKAKAVFVAAAFLIVCFLVAGTAEAQKERSRKVLLLHSYHPNYLWTKLITNSVESVLERYKEPVVVDIEYMDTRHFDDQTHYENLYALYKNKFNRRKYELIITSDNNALLFMLKHRKELCPDVPIVFCGSAILTIQCWRARRVLPALPKRRPLSLRLKLPLNCIHWPNR